MGTLKHTEYTKAAEQAQLGRTAAVGRWFHRLPFAAWVLAAVLLWWSLWCWKPKHPQDFMLEHILTVLFIGTLIVVYKWFRLSNLNYALIGLFLALHIMGAYYTYSEVPYEQWGASFGSFIGVDDLSIQDYFGWERNHYDRLVHAAFGFFLVIPLVEAAERIIGLRRMWRFILPIDFIISLSAIYELLEWGIAVIIAGDVGQSYLGTQGDEWDAHKDIAMAGLGACLAMAGYVLWIKSGKSQKRNYPADQTHARDRSDTILPIERG